MSLEKRNQAILIARRNGMSYGKIGKAHGLARSRIQQICDEAEHRARPQTFADELSARVRNALETECCKITPEAVAKRYTLAELKRVPNIGALSIWQLNKWLIKHGQEPIT